MKKQNLIGVGVIIAAMIGTCLIRPAQSQQVEHRGPAMVIFKGDENYQNGELIQPWYYIHRIQASPNAPQLSEGMPVADASALLLAHHFKLNSSDGWYYVWIRD